MRSRLAKNSSQWARWGLDRVSEIQSGRVWCELALSLKGWISGGLEVSVVEPFLWATEVLLRATEVLLIFFSVGPKDSGCFVWMVTLHAQFLSWAGWMRRNELIGDVGVCAAEAAFDNESSLNIAASPAMVTAVKRSPV